MTVVTSKPNKKQHKVSLIAFGLAVVLGSIGFFLWLRPNPTPVQTVKVRFMQEIDELDSTVSHFQKAIVLHRSDQSIQDAFRRARLTYKQIEFLSAYYSPETTKALNGPNIPDVDDDLRVNEPEGFQVLEELLFPVLEPANQAEATQHAAVLRANVNRLRKISESNDVTDSHVFDAMRLEVFRVITFGITGFDSPVAFHSLPESASALESLQHQLAHYELKKHDAPLAEQLDQAFTQAVQSLRSARDFNRFDRLSFIKQSANMLSS